MPCDDDEDICDTGSGDGSETSMNRPGGDPGHASKFLIVPRDGKVTLQSFPKKR